MNHKSKYRGHGRAYIKVWIGLLILTAITVTVSYHNFGIWNVFVAMLVATVKAALVCLFFMHLIYDNRVNQVIFISAFFFLAIFIGLTASDELYRKGVRPLSIAQTEEKPAAGDVKKFLQPMPELLAKGKEIFAVQCAVCHGVEGKGNGPGAAALNPKPRDFTSGTWRYGGGPARVFKTITDGSPGTAMAGFASLSVQDRFALAHYVRTFSPNPPADKPEDVAAVGGGVAGGEKAPAEAPKLKIPLSFAMKRLAQEEVSLADVNQVPAGKEAFDFGGKLYQARCLSCHGLNGKGGISVKQISVNPPVYLKTKSFAGSQNGWVQSEQEFIDLVSKGLPGSGKPGIAGFTNEEWSALYQYVLRLRP